MITLLYRIGIIIFLVFVYSQWIDYKQKKLEKSALKLIHKWRKSLNSKRRNACKIVETFSKEQCQQLIQQKPFSVSITDASMLASVFQIEIDPEKKECPLSTEQVKELRYEVASYLTELDLTLCFWKSNLVDRFTIEKAFAYDLVINSENPCLEIFRNEYRTIKKLHAIQSFISHIRKEWPA